MEFEETQIWKDLVLGLVTENHKLNKINKSLEKKITLLELQLNPKTVEEIKIDPNQQDFSKYY